MSDKRFAITLGSVAHKKGSDHPKVSLDIHAVHIHPLGSVDYEYPKFKDGRELDWNSIKITCGMHVDCPMDTLLIAVHAIKALYDEWSRIRDGFFERKEFGDEFLAINFYHDAFKVTPRIEFDFEEH